MNWTRSFAKRTEWMKRTAVRELLKVAAQPGIISFAGGLPASELFPLDRVREALEGVLRRWGGRSLQYAETEGIPELRDWIAARYSKPGLTVSRDNVLITTGSQQALDLLGRVFLESGDRVVVENPTYLALLSAWRPQGVEFLGVPSDHAGLCVDALEPVLRRRPKLLYVVPNYQNPLGTTLAEDRRQRLVALLDREDVALVEDDPYCRLRYDGAPLPSLWELDALRGTEPIECRLESPRRPPGLPLPRGEGRGEGTGGPVAEAGYEPQTPSGAYPSHARVIHTSTFSKILMPGLRVGWVVAPTPVIEKLVQAKQAADLHTSSLSQYLALELIEHGFLEQFLPVLRRHYRERRDRMLEALEAHFPADTTWTRPQGGMFLAVTLPPSIDASLLLQAALREGVAFVPGEEFHLNGSGKNTMRLNFSNASPDRISTGIERLARVLARG